MVNDILLNLWRNSRKNHGKNRQNIIFDRAFKGIIMEKKKLQKTDFKWDKSSSYWDIP